jgi:two-component system response regulator YesN
LNKNSDINNSVIQIINDNVKNKISVDLIAKKLNFSRSYLQHIFKDGVGVSISEYILIQKMQTANLLLEEGKLLKEVASELGYKYYPTFFTAYKKFYGFCPKERKK